MAERIEIVEAVGDGIAAAPESLPVTGVRGLVALLRRLGVPLAGA